MRERLSFTRAQLKEIFSDFESIKEFERLIDLVDSLIPSTVVDLEIAAEAADAKGQEALESLGRIARAIEELAAQPPARADNSVVTDYIDLSDAGPHETMPRRVQWNKDDGTMDVGLYNGVVLQSGQEFHVYAKNDEAFTILNGRTVMMSGTVGASGKLKVKLANADGTVDENYMLGLATQDIPSGQFGYVTMLGLVRGFNTTGGDKTVPEVWSDGDVLYFDPAFPGEMTKNSPVAPRLNLEVAIVIKAGAGGSGSVFIHMKTGEHLRTLHDVSAPTPRDLDLIQYNTATKRWESGALPWVDIDFPIIVRTVGAGIPTLTTLNGNITMPRWAVNDYNVCESQELIHGWKEGSTVYWHLHLTTNGLDATARYVRFSLEYGYADVNGTWTFPAVVTTADLLIPANTPDKTMLVMSLANFTPAVHIASHVVARLTRVAAVGAAPTNDPWIPILQLHAQVDTIGSRNIGTK